MRDVLRRSLTIGGFIQREFAEQRRVFRRQWPVGSCPGRFGTGEDIGLGMPGFTAHAGLLTIGRPKPGEIVVVAAASGRKACGTTTRRMICPLCSPSARAASRCRSLVPPNTWRGTRPSHLSVLPATDSFSSLAFAVPLRPDGVKRLYQLMADCPNGIDVYFASVGGHASIGCRMPCRGRNLLTPGTLEPG
ncbi:MAG: hypothetical protein E5X13_03895 [Mesorhizobium sp.]|nr:MAG: hypothetical protein EOQ72_04040 [Mesorhizobium sp.]TIR89099.1 MAG: hypothetical protein E5X08_28975 [Mesorhizobium sp.]TIS03891.1 MAG: hypothetical protein E5X13_03895 [Mesorhizobium sp.]